jgi:hypothetical protein
MTNKTDYVELGLACADVCKALDRGMKGRRADKLSQSVCEAIEQLTRCVEQQCTLCTIHLPRLHSQDSGGDPGEGH